MIDALLFVGIVVLALHHFRPPGPPQQGAPV